MLEFLIPDSATAGNSHSEDECTPLSLAAFLDHIVIAELLLKYGGDPNLQATNPSRVNAPHAAVAKANYELCQLLIERGADVNVSQMKNVTALHAAVHRGNLRLVQLLVDRGARTDLKMENVDTALSIAKRDGHEKVVEYLVAREEKYDSDPIP